MKLLTSRFSGVMVQERGRATITGCTIRGGRMGVGFSSLGEGVVQDCELANVQTGFAIIYNQGGQVQLESNKFLSQWYIHVYYHQLHLVVL